MSQAFEKFANNAIWLIGKTQETVMCHVDNTVLCKRPQIQLKNNQIDNFDIIPCIVRNKWHHRLSCYLQMNLPTSVDTRATIKYTIITILPFIKTLFHVKYFTHWISISNNSSLNLCCLQVLQMRNCEKLMKHFKSDNRWVASLGLTLHTALFHSFLWKVAKP